MSAIKDSAQTSNGRDAGPAAALSNECDPPSVEERTPVEGLQRLWTYERERLPLSCYVRRWRRRWGATAMPQSVELEPVAAKPAWILYFVYAPDGKIDQGHLFTLNALTSGDLPVLAVVACKTPNLVPEPILESCDAVIWKALSGYDFSAYAIGLEAIARCSPGADVLVFNDSVFGPFHDLAPLVAGAPWDLTGFMATDGSNQRHVQSYAFVMKAVRPERLDAMGEILTTAFAFDDARATICCRELWMARQASQTMTVGSYWFGAVTDVLDPTLSKAIELVGAGFPFMKRSLLTKQSHYQQTADVIACLQHHGHPIVEIPEANAHQDAGRGRSLLQRAAGRLMRIVRD